MTPNRRDVLTGIGALGVTALAGAGTAAASSHGGSANASSDPDGPARVRVAHLSPDAPNVDVHVDGETVLSDVPFRAVSDYLSVPAGTYTVAITAAGSDTVVFEGDVEVAAGTDYTVAAIGELDDDSFEPLILTDEPRELPDEVVQVRVVHASPDAPAVDVTTDATPAPLAHALEFGSVSTYHLALSGDATIAVGAADADDDADPVFESDLGLQGGTTYTVFAGGYLTPDDEPAHEPFGLIPAASHPRDTPEPAQVRAAHLSPDAPNVDVYLDDSKVLADVPFGAISQYLPVQPGSYGLKVTAADDPDAVVIDTDLSVESGSAYTVAAIGREADIHPRVLHDDLSLARGQAKFRAFHAVPDAPAVDVSVDGGESDIIDGLPFGEATDYLTVDPGDYTLRVTDDLKANNLIGNFDVQLTPNRVYTVVATGFLDPQEEATDEGFRLLPTVDARPGE